MTTYVAKKPNEAGFIDFTPFEDETWHILYQRQVGIIKNRACQEFIDALDVINMSQGKIPQCPDMSKVLAEKTGWGVHPVAALISNEEFFGLLKNRLFPAATFIRLREELDYLQEPDLFHEYFGHGPLLTNQAYADFLQWYGDLALTITDPARSRLLARLFWYTIEFGIMKTEQGFRIYGGGILSSPGETVYAVESDVPERRPFDIETALRTPYRYDMMQPIYYYIESFSDLYKLMEADLPALLDSALAKGDFAPHPSLLADNKPDVDMR